MAAMYDDDGPNIFSNKKGEEVELPEGLKGLSPASP